MEVKSFFEHLFDADLVAAFFYDRALHGVGLSSAGRAVYNQVAVSALQELFTHVLPIAVHEHLLLSALLSKHRLKNIFPFSIVEVIVGVKFDGSGSDYLALAILAGRAIALNIDY